MKLSGLNSVFNRYFKLHKNKMMHFIPLIFLQKIQKNKKHIFCENIIEQLSYVPLRSGKWFDKPKI